MDGKTAWLFPGQGSQYTGMGGELRAARPEAAGVFEEADAVLGIGLTRLCLEGPDGELRRTAVTQPAVLTVSVAASRVLEAEGLRPDFAAGHSLGEYGALVAAGAIRFADAVSIVRRRGRYMQEAVPEGEGAMAALIGVEAARVEELCREAAAGGVVSPANFNSPDQVVVSGHAGSVERLVDLAREAGAKRVIPLEVSAPFHCALMAPAAERLRGDLERLEIRDPEIPVVCNVSGETVQTAAEVRAALAEQVSKPVRWYETVVRLLGEGVDTFVEVGPGRVLSGLVRRIDRSVRVLNVADLKSLEKTLAVLGRSAR